MKATRIALIALIATGALGVGMIAPASAADAPFGVDASIRVPGGILSGVRVVNETGYGQSILGTARPGRTARYEIGARSFGSEPDILVASGCTSNSRFRVRYETLAGLDVTEQVTLGMYDSGPLEQDGTIETLILTVRPRDNVDVGARFNCLVTMASSGDFEVRDAVKAILKVV